MLAFLVVLFFVGIISSLIRLIRAAIQRDPVARRQNWIALGISILLFVIFTGLYVASVVHEYRQKAVTQEQVTVEMTDSTESAE